MEVTLDDIIKKSQSNTVPPKKRRKKHAKNNGTQKRAVLNAKNDRKPVAQKTDIDKPLDQIQKERDTKKRPCMFFQQGACRNGDKCSWAHVISPDLPPRDVVRDTNRRRSSMGNKSCAFYFNGTGCRNGDKCPWRHEIPQSPKNDALDSPGESVDRIIFHSHRHPSFDGERTDDNIMRRWDEIGEKINESVDAAMEASVREIHTHASKWDALIEAQQQKYSIEAQQQRQMSSDALTTAGGEGGSLTDKKTQPAPRTATSVQSSHLGGCLDAVDSAVDDATFSGRNSSAAKTVLAPITALSQKLYIEPVFSALALHAELQRGEA
uniref:C3H1-type domain-containing protein n=1 Tax=Octactis speculum TaxID=3111310 RepID=A0A7S2HP65_9STRA|mmetsp:Transcript_8220/g.10385  ORF Transcript_8220/g.10385 Transcript_8220/m.10385 type:complete len:323 (+) Transcript_8220:52-1020(+)